MTTGKNAKWGLMKGKARLGVLRENTNGVNPSYKYRLTGRLRLRAGFKVNILQFALLVTFSPIIT